MNVELVNDSFAPEEGGGATFLDDVAAAVAAERGSRHRFFVLSPFVRPAALAPESNIEWVQLRRSGLDRVRAKVIRSGRRSLARIGCKFSSPSPDQALFAEARRRIGIHYTLATSPFATLDESQHPYIATVWDVENRLKPCFPEVGSRDLYDRRESHFHRHLGRAAQIIVGTSEGKRQIGQLYAIPAGRISVIPMITPRFALNAGDDPGSAPSAAADLAPGGFLFYPAQFWAHKNHVHLLRALALLKREGSIHPLVLTGSDKGNLRHVREEAERLGVQDQVRFAGFVSRPEMIWLYRNCLALAYVSFFGPDNLPPLEAFALGCPVIAARLPGCEEQLGDAALLADPASDAEIAASVRTIAADAGLRASLIARGRKRAGRTTPSDYALKLLALLDDLERVRVCWA